jgi:CMP/dCMP kinase
MIITISGNPGSGKSTIAEYVAKTMGLERIYVGEIRRKIALKMGISLEELNKISLNNPEYDVEVDKKVKEQVLKIAEHKDVLVEGRIQFFFFPESLKIYVYCDPKVAAERIWKDVQNGQRKGENYQSYEQVLKSIDERESNDAKRYLKYYGVDNRDQNHYDLVIETTNLTQNEALSLAFKKINNYLERSEQK